MILTDTHTHLFNSQFDGDIDEVVARAVEAGVKYMLLPAVDSQSHEALMSLAGKYHGSCYAMMGLHPTSVNDNPDFRRELGMVGELLKNPPVRFYAIGETGLDLYWSKDFLKEQTEALCFQIELALEYGLPVVLHTRDSFNEIFEVLEDYKGSGLKGVFHSFSGGVQECEKIKALGGFRFGISGPVTYKNSTLPEVVSVMDIDDILLETDSPYLPPVPFRGKRNESSYINYIAGKVAEIKGLTMAGLAAATTRNAMELFNLPGNI